MTSSPGVLVRSRGDLAEPASQVNHVAHTLSLHGSVTRPGSCCHEKAGSWSLD